MSTLFFPKVDTLRLALTSSIVPFDVAGSPLNAHFDEQGAIFVQPSVKLARSTLTELKKLGVVESKKKVDLSLSSTCWPQLIEVERDRDSNLPPASTPVFLEVPEDQLGEVVGEMLRLGVDRQSFRWIVGTDQHPKALLRVVGPPYFSLLRAIDRVDRDLGPVAYVEQAPRVLVEFGYRHPLADRILPPQGQVLLIREPKAWRFVEEAPFRDVYSALNFSIPEKAPDLRAIELSRKYDVPLRLSRGSSSDAAELWVLRHRGEEQVEELVGSSDNHLIARLSFAVGEGPTVVIRVRPSKQPPPALILEGVAFRPYLKIPNLFLPVGSRLHPPLRRDAVTKLLAADGERVTWLSPKEDSQFVLESLPDAAFRPLDQWVDYVLDRDQRTLQAWVESTWFEFEPFACEEEPKDEDFPRPERKKKKSRMPLFGRAESEVSGLSGPSESSSTEPREEFRQGASEAPGEFQPDADYVQLGKLETRYRELDSSTDHPERRALLLEMADLNVRLDRPSDASGCWALAVWEQSELPAEVVRRWAESEPRSAALSSFAVKSVENPTSSDLRGLATGLIRLGFGDPKTHERIDRIEPIQQFLERHEHALPARMVWLSWLAVYRLNRGDVLTLARARDRLLERLHRGGLRPDLDLPGFLRFGAGESAERNRLILDHLIQFRTDALKWADQGHMVAPQTKILADLIFAFGLARLGNGDLSSQILKMAKASIRHRDLVMILLVGGFEHRIGQALEGKPPVGPLPSDILERLEVMGKEGLEDDKKRDKEQRYKVDRLRKNSRILEPHERINPYRHWTSSNVEGLTRELGEWPDITDLDVLKSRVTKTLEAPRPESDADLVRATILREALEVSFRLGEETAVKILKRVLPVAGSTGDPIREADLLEKGLRVAAHYDRTDDVRAFVARFDALLESGGAKGANALEPLIGQCFRGLRKLGLRAEIETLLARLSEVVLKGRDLSLVGPRSGHPAIEWSKTLKVMLQVSSVWFDLGDGNRALPVLDEVRSLLLEGELLPIDQTSLASAYIRSMALASPELALPRMAELFVHLERVHDSFTTTSHYSSSRLEVIESAVSTMVSEDFALDRSSRSQLEDDEFLVRRRIHRDVREALEAAN